MNSISKSVPQTAVSSTAESDLALLADLRARWPILAEPKPLKLGVRQDIRAALDSVSGVRIARALLAHINTREYQAALAAGGARYALDGSPCGEVTESHQRHAKAVLEGRAQPGTTKTRKKPTRQKAQPAPAQVPPKPIEAAPATVSQGCPIPKLRPKAGPVVSATVNRKEAKL